MRYWFLNAVCGLIVLVLLAFHMFTMHLDDVFALIFGGSAEPLSWVQVSGRGASNSYTWLYVVLLGTALFHGFYGLRTVLTEIWSSARASKLIGAGCWLLGLGLFVIGAAAAIAYHTQQVGV
jgi:succinate dehydrogenase / fumarate reductase membrane anchor subunit